MFCLTINKMLFDLCKMMVFIWYIVQSSK